MSSSPMPADSAAGVSPVPLSPPGRSRRPVDVAAVAALVFGILPLAPLALAAGLAGLARTRGGHRAGRGAAIGGLVLAGAWAVAGTVAAVTLLVPGPAAIHRLPRDTVFGLRTGQCVNTAPNGVTGARVVPCGQPHMAEIYATYRLAGTDWPGATAAGRRARQGCQARLGGYLDPSLLGSSLTASAAYPGQTAWAAGERTVVCEIRPVSGRFTGSVRGLGRTAG